MIRPPHTHTRVQCMSHNEHTAGLQRVRWCTSVCWWMICFVSTSFMDEIGTQMLLMLHWKRREECWCRQTGQQLAAGGDICCPSNEESTNALTKIKQCDNGIGSSKSKTTILMESIYAHTRLGDIFCWIFFLLLPVAASVCPSEWDQCACACVFLVEILLFLLFFCVIDNKLNPFDSFTWKKAQQPLSSLSATSIGFNWIGLFGPLCRSKTIWLTIFAGANTFTIG